MEIALLTRRCPCGSGLKLARCCGDAGRPRRGATDALQEAFMLPSYFPRLRARGPGAARWVTVVTESGLEDGLVDTGVASLGEAERRRIVRECARRHRRVWRTLLREVADADAAAEALVSGAVVAAAVERMPPPSSRLVHLDAAPGLHAADALAVAIRPDDLWSVVETAELGEALHLVDGGLDEEEYEVLAEAVATRTARRLATRWHARRLELLVGRLAEQLPYAGHPRASSTLAHACGAFERHAFVRRRLATLLLLDSLSRTRVTRAHAPAIRRAA